MAVMERDLAQGDLIAVRRGMGGALRALYSDVLREGIPDRIAELLSQLDQKDSDSGSVPVEMPRIIFGRPNYSS
jgi:hypothetical protein